MAVLNKRNAVLGWAVWNMSKRAAKRKARQTASTDTARTKKGVAAGLAALGGASLFFWRRRRADVEPG
jgi:LPXTG-motif cell wall-anchored protein